MYSAFIAYQMIGMCVAMFSILVKKAYGMSHGLLTFVILYGSLLLLLSNTVPYVK